MNRTNILTGVVIALTSSTVTIVFEHMLVPKPAVAGQANPAQELVLYAGARKDTDRGQSFIFYDPRTGDIWVYRDGDAKDHFRFKAPGQDLERIK